MGLNIVGADVVEVSPAYDHADVTSLAAATLVFEMMALLTKNVSPDGVAEDGVVALSV